jgi:hypothetical protein
MTEDDKQSELPDNPAQQWYRYGWVWFVFTIPFAAVLFGIVMIVSANYQPDDVVVDNYYKEGKGINKRIARDAKAAELGVQVTLAALTETGAVFDIEEAGGDVQMSLFHVTDQQQDMSFQLVSQGEGTYTVSSAEFARRLSQPGIWYIEFTDYNWRLRTRLQTPVSMLELGPS